MRKEIEPQKSVPENDDGADENGTVKKDGSLDFRNKKVPSYIVTFAQVS